MDVPLALTTPPLLSHSVTYSSTPSPLQADVVYGRPLITIFSSHYRIYRGGARGLGGRASVTKGLIENSSYYIGHSLVSKYLYKFINSSILLQVGPCERQNLPNFGLSRNSKHAVFRNFPKLQKCFVKIVFRETRKCSKTYVFYL